MGYGYYSLKTDNRHQKSVREKSHERKGWIMTSLTTATVEFPLLLVNMKTYRESLGKKAVSLASMAGKVAEKTQICVAVAPQAVDLRFVVREVDIPVYSQHIDPVGYGKFTGHVLPEGVADAGCVGTLINHSERRLPLTVIEATVKKAGELGLNSVVCVDTSEQARRVTPFNPDVIAVEPPELIGTGIPVSKARPEIVSNSVKAVKKINPNVILLDTVIALIAGVAIFAPVFAIIAPRIPFREINLFGGVFGTINSQVLFLVLSFMVWGAIIGGHIIGYATYMLEIAPLI